MVTPWPNTGLVCNPHASVAVMLAGIQQQYLGNDRVMKVIVLGSGIIGTASAWFLNKAGHDVTLTERQPGAAQETSLANGSLISVSHATPWANKGAPLTILKALGKEDAPLLYRFRAEWLQWKWGMNFLRECTPQRTVHNMHQIVAIAEYSRQTLQAVRQEAFQGGRFHVGRAGVGAG